MAARRSPAPCHMHALKPMATTDGGDLCGSSGGACAWVGSLSSSTGGAYVHPLVEAVTSRTHRPHRPARHHSPSPLAFNTRRPTHSTSSSSSLTRPRLARPSHPLATLAGAAWLFSLAM